MGEVYRARDTRLGRDVAVKIVPPAVAANADALGRFERETRAVAALSHPNILTIYDVGRSDGTAYAVLELLEGQTLRARLDGGALPQRKALEIAAQMARGLAAAHDKQIAHRDLKPENVFVTADGSVKILDFGLARQLGAVSAGAPDSATIAPSTEPGMVLGTVGYMAPEQVRGEPSDHRADIFALGCVLYEMLTGRRPFQRDTGAETMTAILKEDPPDPDKAGVVVSPGVLRTLRRCLEKRPEERFQSARDLAFALESAMETSSASGGRAGTGEPAAPELKFGPTYGKFRPTYVGSPGRAIALGFVVGAVLAGALSMAMLRQRPADVAAASHPTFRRLAYDLGTVRDARFMPDGQSVIYGAAWNGDPLRLFMTRTDSQESVRLSLPEARLLSISKSGEMAVSLGHVFEGWMGMGTLARTSMLGSAPRVLMEHIREAEWSPDGAELAIVRRIGGLEQLEFPAGHVLYKSSGYISDIRLLARWHAHRLYRSSAVCRRRRRGVDGRPSRPAHGVVGRLHLGARPGVVGGWHRDLVHRYQRWRGTRRGVRRDAGRPAAGGDDQSSGHEAVRHRPGRPRAAGRSRRQTEGWRRCWQDRQSRAMSRFAKARTASGSPATAPASRSPIRRRHATPLTSCRLEATRRLSSARATRTASRPIDVWALALPVTGAPVLLHPTGAGKTRELPNPESLLFDTAAWLPDNRRIVLFGQQAGKPGRGYVQDIESGAPRPFTAEGVSALRWWSLPVAPDGSRVIARGEDGVPAFFRVSDGAHEPVPGLRPGESPIRFSGDGRGLLVAHGNGLPWVVERMDIATGRRTPALEIRAREAAGLRLSIIDVTPDARHYVHSYSRLLTDLFVVKGLK